MKTTVTHFDRIVVQQGKRYANPDSCRVYPEGIGKIVCSADSQGNIKVSSDSYYQDRS